MLDSYYWSLDHTLKLGDDWALSQNERVGDLSKLGRKKKLSKK